MENWWIYKGTHEPHDEIALLPPPPGWRKFGETVDLIEDYALTPQARHYLSEKARGFQIGPDEINMVNAALYLRRPLLITGKPGSGKSTLAYAVAYELQLGAVLRWSITTNVSLQNGLYHYDAIGRLQQVSLESQKAAPQSNAATDIGQFLRLGPLGTALLPRKYPRVLLIDEIDKSDIDLPNNLLHIFEEGEYEIPELMRLSKQSERIPVMPYDSPDENHRVFIQAGKVRCAAFPLVILTSNEEREFPPAFLRRCLRLEMEPPDEDRLTKIVEARLGAQVVPQVKDMITDFIRQRASDDLATDQLLNAVYMVTQQYIEKDRVQKLLASLLRSLTNEAPEEG